MNFQIISGLFLVGSIWGITNPYLERGVTNEKQDLVGFKSFLKTITNFKFIIPFGINQSGSILYYYLLGQAPLSIASAFVNCVNTSVTIITESILKKQKIGLQTIIGILFIILGTILICL
ncbi:hypothetical protein pb186bvf_002195 [Paramecium bursaria]